MNKENAVETVFNPSREEWDSYYTETALDIAMEYVLDGRL